MVAALEGVESGTVKWSVLAATQDTNDADREPNFGSFRGAVLFTPSRSTIRRLLPDPFTIFLDPVLGQVGDDGILRDLSGLEGVVLVSPNATGIEETGWTWEASFQLNQREKVAFSFTFDPDEVVDLTRLTPVLSSPGLVMTKGDKGDAATVAVGTVTTGAPGSSATVANSGNSSAAVFDFAIPRGATGATPILAGTSATSDTIATGSQVFVTQAGMALQVGDFVRIVSRANTANYMAGPVTAYSGTSLTVNVTETGGSGTFTDWNINLSGVKGATGNTGAVPVISGTSATSITPGAGSKVFTTQSGMALTVGQYVRVASSGTPADYMAGNITAYSGTSLTVNVIESSGSTARTDWQISLTGTRGATGAASTVPGPAPTISGTSATSFTPSLGSKVFTTQAGIALVVGQYVRIASTAVPADFMAGAITAYSGTSLTVNVDAFNGTTARTDWNISITGTTGAQGPVGAGAPDATTATKGSVRLAGDLGGTADAPTVPELANRSIMREFDPGQPGGAGRQFMRIATLDGVSDTGGAHLQFILAGTGDYGDLDRGTLIVHFAQRNSNVISVKAWSFDVENTLDQVEFYTKQISTWVFELWAKLSDYNLRHQLHVLSASHVIGSTSVKINLDSAQTATPAGLSAVITPTSITQATADVAAGTSSGTGSTLVKRDSGGGAAFGWLTVSPQGGNGSDVARRDFVEGRDRWTPTLKTGATYTFALADETNHILSNDTVAQTYTIPLNSAVAFPLGTKIQLTRWNTGTLTIAATGGVTLNAVNSNRALAQYESCLLVKVATDSWLIVDLATAATTSVQGMVELADNTETQTGTDSTRAVTPAGLQSKVATATALGIVELATTAEATTGTDSTRAMTPQGDKAALDAALAQVPYVIQHDGTTVANRPATTRPVHWIVPFAFSLPANGTTAGGTKASVDNLDLVSRY